MNIQHMKYAVEVEKTGSISQAADNLFMGQPNLSKAIKELELSLGIRIFKRTTRGVTPTTKGKEFLDGAKKILETIEEMEARYQPGGQKLKSFSISVPRCSYIASAFTAFLSELDEDEIEVNFSETNSIQAINNVVEEGQHLGIIRYHSSCEPYFLQLLSDQNLSHKLVWEFHSLLVLSGTHPLAGRDSITAGDLDPYVEIYQSGCPAQNRFYRKANQQETTAARKKQVCVHGRGSQFDLLTQVSGTYMWTSPVPRDVLLHNGLVQRTCADTSYRLKDVLIYPRGYRFNRAEQFFLEKLEEAKQKTAMS